jgi:heat shock protein beta
MLQQSKTLEIIKRKLIRKALEMIRSIVKDEEAVVKKEKDEKGDVEEDGTGERTAVDEEKDGKGGDKSKSQEMRPYVKFWKEYGKMIKLGVIEDSLNRARLAKLLRFRTSKSDMDDPNDWISLDQYLDRMKPDQESIYYHSGENAKAIASSPFLEKLLKKGYEVIYLTEPIDEHMITHLTDYEGSKFMSAAKDDFKFGEKDQKEEKSKASALKKTYKPLTRFLKKRLGDKVSKVKLSTRLSNTPCAISNEQWGYSARMELIMKAQAFADPDSFQYTLPKAKIMELNPHHPIVKKMLEMANDMKDAESDSGKEAEERLVELGHLLYDTALISSGYIMQDSSEFASRMYKLLATSADVDPNAVVEDAVPDSRAEDEKDSKEDMDIDDFDTDDLMSKMSSTTSGDDKDSVREGATDDLADTGKSDADEHDEL